MQDFADLVVQIGDVGEIGLSRAADVFFGDVEVAPVVGIEDALCMRVVVVVVHRRNLRQQVLAVFVEVPVLLAGDIRIVRVGEADRQAERAVVFAAAVVVDLAHGLEGDIVVIFHLVGNLGNAGARD